MVANTMPRLAVLVGGATFFALGLLSDPSAVMAASDAFEEERFRYIVNEAPDEVGIDPREFYEQEMFMASRQDEAPDVGGRDMAGRRRKLVGIFDATDASSKARAAMERILGGRSESRRKKSLFKKESSKSKDTKKSSKSRIRTIKRSRPRARARRRKVKARRNHPRSPRRVAPPLLMTNRRRKRKSRTAATTTIPSPRGRQRKAAAPVSPSRSRNRNRTAMAASQRARRRIVPRRIAR